MGLLGRFFFKHPDSDPIPQPKKKAALFIPGSFAFWCSTCWGAYSTFNQEHEKCERCGGKLQFIATDLRSPMEPPAPRRPFVRPKPQENSAAFLTDFRTPKDAA